MSKHIETYPNLTHPYPNLCSHIQTCLALSKPVQPYQNVSGPVQTYPNLYQTYPKTIMNLSKHFKTYLSKFIQNYPNLHIPIQPYQRISKPIETCIGYTNLFQTCIYPSKLYPF